jgi:outer membrane protein OmpA-like peptidoglycan-associated protein
LKITGSNSYSGAYTQSGGVTLLTSSSFSGHHNINNGSVIELSTGASLASGSKYELNGSTMIISASGNITFSVGQVIGTEGSVINKTGSGKLSITGNSGGYTGWFTQSGGETILTAAGFSGMYEINNGSKIELAGGASVTSGSFTINGSTMIISANSNIRFNGQISGTAGSVISKTGSGILELAGNGSEYKGIYEQSAGTAVVSGNSFGGTHKINTGSAIEFATGSSFTSGSGYEINNAVMTISAGNDLRFNGELSGNGVINKSGSGKLIFERDIMFTEGTLNATGGEIGFVSGANYSGKGLNIDGGTLNMQNDSAEEISVKDFKSVTNTKIDIFSNGKSDKIIAENAEIGGKIDIRAGVGRYRDAEYELIIATRGALSGEFISKSISDLSLEYEVSYASDIVRLLVKSGIKVSRFNILDGLSYNQRETARTFDEMSQDPSDGWVKVLSDMETERSVGDVEKVKDFLARTSGYFLANVIRSASAESSGEAVYEKIKSYERGETGNSVWAQLKGGAETYKGNDNSLGDYKDLSVGLMLGIDRYIEEKGIMIGGYGKINKENIEQEGSKAQGSKSGLGVYGGYIEEGYELKGMLEGSYDILSTERAVMGEIGRGDIKAFTIRGDIEGALKYEMSEEVKIKPYLGLEISDTGYERFKEKGAGIYNLDVKEGSYIRSGARIGAGIEYEKEKIRGYAKAEGKYILSGREPEIESEFMETGIKFKSRGSEEGMIEMGIGIGGEIKVTENFTAYVNIRYYVGDRYENIYGNSGVRYVFGRVKREKVKEEIIGNILKERDILEVWETQGDEEGKIKISKEIADKFWLGEGDKVYGIGYKERVFFFNDKEKMKVLIKELREAGIKKKEIKVMESEIKEGKILFNGFRQELGDMREGMLIVKYERGLAEVKSIPEEAKRVKRNEIINKVVKESQASMIIELREEKSEIVMRKEMSTKLGIKKDGKIYLANYGTRIFLFKDKGEAEKFIERIQKAGAAVGEENLRELEGVYIKDEVTIKREDIRELGDLSKGIILEEYKDEIKEMKSVAEEEKRKEREAINREKLREAQGRRESKAIKSYRLNIANFGINEYELTKEAKETIKKQAKEIRENEYKKITVEGHSDSIGQEEVNNRISRKRGEEVYKEFLLNGIPAGKISYIGFGARMPIDANTTKEGRAANRRTEIFVE